MSDKGTPDDVVSIGRIGRGIRGKDLSALHSYWHSMRKNGDVPRRSDIDPRGIESLLENALIAEKIAPGLARLRIAGQHLSDIMGMEVRGMPVSAFIAPDHRDQLAEALTELFERPAVITLDLTSPGAMGCPEMQASLVLMPLRSDLGDVSRALGCLVSRGGIGRTPRRFDITALRIEALSTSPPQIQEHTGEAKLRGLAEHQKPFAPGAPGLTSERPYLRLVRSEDEDGEEG